jgi:hypothetical protein
MKPLLLLTTLPNTMTTQKLSSLAFLILLICLCSCSSKKQQPSAALPKEPTGLTLTAQVAGIGRKPDCSVIYVIATLFNPTKDTINFVGMLCSYSDYFLTDTSAYYFWKEDCYANYQTILRIPPGYKLDQLIHLVPKNWEVIKSVTPRIGMYLEMFTTKEISKGGLFINYHFKKEGTPIIWSNPIDLNRLNRKPYK